jgi:hypothetical protein
MQNYDDDRTALETALQISSSQTRRCPKIHASSNPSVEPDRYHAGQLNVHIFQAGHRNVGPSNVETGCRIDGWWKPRVRLKATMTTRADSVDVLGDYVEEVLVEQEKRMLMIGSEDGWRIGNVLYRKMQIEDAKTTRNVMMVDSLFHTMNEE